MRPILYVLLFCTTLFTSNHVYAQGAHAANIRFGKLDRSGLAVEYPYSKGIVETALRSRMERAGFGRPKSAGKGFSSYPGVKWTELTNTQVDVYTTVDASKNNQSTIILLVSKGYDNYISEASDPEVFVKLKAFLDSLLPDIQAAQLAADIAAQEDVLKRAEKDYKDKDDDGKKLAREKEKIERQLADNDSEKRKSADALSAAKARLEQLKSDASK